MRIFGLFESQNNKSAPKIEEKNAPVVTGPIMACIGPRHYYTKEDQKYINDLQDVSVDYFADVRNLNKLNYKNAGKLTYVISDIDSKNKGSYDYKNCTGVVAVGVDKETGVNVSMLTHQDPRTFIRSGRKQFEADLKESLLAFMARIKKGSEDVAIFGGNFFPLQSGYGGTFADDYEESIKDLGRYIKASIGVDARVIVGPNTSAGGGWNATLDTQNRRLYLYRPLQEGFETDQDFKASEVTDKKRKILKEIDPRSKKDKAA